MYVKLILKDVEIKSQIINEAKRLKGSNHLNGVYIKNDETKLSRKENYRLRQKRRTLKTQHTNTDIKIEKGKIIQDGLVVDKYDITNQLFC